MSDASNGPAAYVHPGHPDALIQEHRCPLGCNAAVVSVPGRDVAIWSRGKLIFYVRVNPHSGEPWLLPALARAVAHASGESDVDSAAERYRGELQDLRELNGFTGAANDDLVDALIDVLTLVAGESFDHAAVGERVLAALDADRERTDTDEWDESDHRCALYNLAHEMAGRP